MTQTKTSVSLSSKLKTEEAIHTVKAAFERHLTSQLPLTKVSAPAVVLQGTGVNDDLNGVERPVSFPVKALAEQKAEVVQSLAKWKRLRLAEYELAPGDGIFTDMKALRPDEETGPLHSVFVDQWDWEMILYPEQRHLDFLKSQVRKIYFAILETERELALKYPLLTPFLPTDITFLHSEDLLEEFPDLSPKQREAEAAKKFGAIFLIGIGGTLKNGEPHDGRAPDYDDWTTPTSSATKGLNGDIIFWNPVLRQPFEISSMGIRVDPEVLLKQLSIRKVEDRRSLFYHKTLLSGQLPQTIGGGIGQSRLCMFLLRKRHIGEVQVGIWSESYIARLQSEDIFLL